MPYSPHQNGVAERQFRTLFERVRAILFESGLPEEFWGEALNFVVYVRARLPSRALGMTKTPFEAWTGKKPDLSHIRPFGCICWAFNHEAFHQKLKFRGTKYRLLGYGQGNNQYRLWSIDKKSILDSAYVVFDEQASIQTAVAEGALDTTSNSQIPDIPDESTVSDDWDDDWAPDPLFSYVAIPPVAGPQGAEPQGAENTNTNVRESTYNFARGTNAQNAEEIVLGEVEEEIPDVPPDDRIEDVTEEDIEAIEPSLPDEPPQEQSVQRRSTRPHATINYHDLHSGKKAFVTKAAKLELHLNTNRIPKTLKEALSSTNRPKWLEAATSELRKCTEQEVWTLAVPPAGRKVLPGRWVLSTKLNPSGSIAKYKARWVAKGFEQIEGIDFFAIFSSVVKSSSWKALLAIGCLRDIEIELSDVDTAFLNAQLKQEVWVEQPHEFVIDGTEHMACRLNEALYGLKQSAREWFDTLKEVLKRMGFRGIQKDQSVYVNGDRAIIATYVDDILIMANSQRAMAKIKAQLSEHFSMKHLGPTTSYLGMEVIRDRAAGTMRITQKGYISQLLAQLGMTDCHTVKSPMDRNIKLETPPATYVAEPELVQAYQSIIGALNWVAGMTRPDISYTVGRLSRHLKQPTLDHLAAAKRLVRYLAGTIDLGITFGPQDGHNGALVGYTDSSWHDDADNGRSTAGYLFKLANGPISWRSKQEKTVALSSTEAEYIASTEACKEALFLKDLMLELSYNQGDMESILLRVDNDSAIALAGNPVDHPRTKHIRLRYHKIRELVANGDIKTEWVSTEQQAADPLTKPMPAGELEHVCRLLGLSSARRTPP